MPSNYLILHLPLLLLSSTFPIRWVVTLNSCKISLPSKGTRPLGTYRKEWSFPDSSVGKNLPAMQEIRVLSLGQEDSLEEGMATHLSILA